MIEEYPLKLSDDRTDIITCDRRYHGDIIVPKTVKSIGIGAFYGCHRLTSVKIPNSVSRIGDRALKVVFKKPKTTKNNEKYSWIKH